MALSQVNLSLDDAFAIHRNDSLGTMMSNGPGSMKFLLERLSEAEGALADIRRALTMSDATWTPSKPVTTISEACWVPADSNTHSVGPKASIQTSDEKKSNASKGWTPLRSDSTNYPFIRGVTDISDKSRKEKDRVKEDEVTSAVQIFSLPRDQVSRIYEIFQGANKNSSGFMSSQELEELLVSLCEGMIDPDQILFIMDKFDKDQDGCLGFQEFLMAFVNTPLMKVFHIENQLKERAAKARQHTAEHECLEPEYWAEMMGCRVSSLKAYIKKESSEAASCLAIPWVILMFALYYLSTHLHLGYEQLHTVDQAIYFDLTENANFAFSGAIPFEQGRMGHKNMFDVNSIGDFWSWLDLGLSPLVWFEGWDLSEYRSNVGAWCYVNGPPANNSPFCIDNQKLSLPQRPAKFYDNITGTYLYYNTVVGGVRLRQERAETSSCSNNAPELVAGLQPGPCLTDAKYPFAPDQFHALHTDKSLLDRPGGRTEYLKSRLPQSKIRERIRDLENQVWFSPYTSKVEVMFTTFNPHLDVFTATNILFFVNRGGHFFKATMPTSFYLTPYRNIASFVVDIMMLLLTMKIVCEESREISKSCCRHGWKSGLRLYCQPSNVVDWLNVVSFIVVAIFWLMHVFRIRKLKDHLRKADVRDPGSFLDQNDLEVYYDLVDDAALSEVVVRTVLAIFPYIVGLRFFKVFSIQPRLGVVTATLQNSVVDLLHFGVVFLCIFVVFVLSAMILFGHHSHEFTNFGRAFVAVFRAMLGEYDWDKMVMVGRFQAAIWFWSFTWLVNFIMLNMLLAIIMDTYTAVKSSIPSDAESLWSQVFEIWRRWIAVRDGRQVPLDVILETLEKAYPEDLAFAEDSERLTVEALIAVVPHMIEEQATRLLVGAYQDFDAVDAGQSSSMSETMTRVKHIFKSTQSLHKSSENATSMIEALMELCKMNFHEMRYQHHKDNPKSHANRGARRCSVSASHSAAATALTNWVTREDTFSPKSGKKSYDKTVCDEHLVLQMHQTSI